jgi:predicted branched-subunit amino acid permease
VGAREGTPFAAASFVMAISFGVVATQSGLSAASTLAFSGVVFAASAQFAAVAILSAGGGLGAIVLAVALINSRFVPMGFALAPSLRGSRWRRALEGQALVDPSWAMASRGDGTFDRHYMFGHFATQYVSWMAGTAVGVLVPEIDARALGLDAVFPAFLIAVLRGEVGTRGRLTVAIGGAVIALLLVPYTPPGAPVLIAGCAALVGLRAGQPR